MSSQRRPGSADRTPGAISPPSYAELEALCRSQAETIARLEARVVELDAEVAEP